MFEVDIPTGSCYTARVTFNHTKRFVASARRCGASLPAALTPGQREEKKVGQKQMF